MIYGYIFLRTLCPQICDRDVYTMLPDRNETVIVISRQMEQLTLEI